MTARVIAPYPWQRALRFTRRELAARRDLEARLWQALDVAQLSAAISQLLGADARAGDVVWERTPRAGTAATVIALRLPSHGLWLGVEPEPELLRASVARLLAQDFALGWADVGVDPPLAGAGAALTLELARRTARGEAPEFVAFGAGAAPPAGAALHGSASVWLREAPYRVTFQVRAIAELATLAGSPVARPARLRALGGARLRVPWVCALSTATPDLVAGLGRGDVWLPGANAWLGDAPPTSGVIAPSRSARGMPVRVSNGRIVLGAEPVLLHEEPEANVTQEESEIEQIVGETPVVVRLEIGALELTAAEWASLRPGDVVQSGRRIEDGVVLRAAGREIARGELVEIEGEVGVRITQVGAARAPA